MSRKNGLILGLLCVVVLFSGCTDWKKKYQALNVEHQNTLGLLERERQEKQQMSQELTEGQQTIEELQQKISELNQSPAQASGFGEGYDVSIDAAKGTVTVTLPNAILFAPGKASLKSATNTELDHIVSVLKSKYSGKMVDVVGHTDSDPIKKSNWDDNWELSAQRALSVARYLMDRGISEDKIRAVGRGSSQPVASNATKSGKARNRRVEIVVHMR
jgi:chemotaxis protein MotB